MRYAVGHKEHTKLKIVRTAAKLFATHGFAATSIDAIMHACNLTRGGFYSHFKSKSELYREAIALAAPGNGSDRCKRTSHDWLDVLLDEFLSDASVATAPMTFLATDIANDNPDVRTAYAKAIHCVQERLRKRITAQIACDEATVLSVIALIVGAMAITQTVDSADLKADLLAACKGKVRALILATNEQQPTGFFWDALGVSTHRPATLHN
jgi:TetR/AcrR family transcriptional repressor of nem operon